jgi:branched-subunit amino acid ABC-type transport system permease component
VTRTKPLVLVVAAVLGALAGFLLDQALTATGRPTFTPSISLPIMLALLAVVVVTLALPIRRATRPPSAVTAAPATPAPPIDPFRALRIAMLAKASSIVGAAVGGAGLGLLAFLLTRPVPPPLGSVGAVAATVIAAAVLVAAALVAENMCIIRKDDDDEPPQPAAGGDAAHPW